VAAHGGQELTGRKERRGGGDRAQSAHSKGKRDGNGSSVVYWYC
jgi:hypothetical protein